MSKKILFDKRELLGDTVKSDFNGIDNLNCFEYSFWQLMRQVGIKDYQAVLGMTCFIVDSNNLMNLYNLATIQENLKKLEFNIRKLYDVKKNNCNALKFEELYQFIKDKIDNNKFIYMLYDNRYDSLNSRSSVDHLHSTVITGYDDERKQYIPIEDGYYNVKYSDHFKMYDSFRKDVFWKDWTLFAIDPVYKEIRTKYTFQEILEEINTILKDWEYEIRFMEQCLNYLDLELLKDKNYVYKIRIQFYLLGVGVHGNLYLKIKLFESYLGCVFEQFYKRYENNRKICQIIAAKIGRLVVEYKKELLDQILNLIYETYVEESKKLRNEFLMIVSRMIH